MSAFEIYSEVQTRRVNLIGGRQVAFSDWSSHTAPDGFVIDEKKIQTETLNYHGTEHSVNIGFSDYLTQSDSPDIKYPKSIKVQTHVVSLYDIGSRGWNRVIVRGEYIKFP